MDDAKKMETDNKISRKGGKKRSEAQNAVFHFSGAKSSTNRKIRGATTTGGCTLIERSTRKL